MISYPQYAKELQAKTGQSKSPTLELDGKFLPDTGVENVAQWLEERGIML